MAWHQRASHGAGEERGSREQRGPHRPVYVLWGSRGPGGGTGGRVSRLTALLLCCRRHSYRTGQDIANCGTCRDCACIIYRYEAALGCSWWGPALLRPHSRYHTPSVATRQSRASPSSRGGHGTTVVAFPWPPSPTVLPAPRAVLVRQRRLARPEGRSWHHKTPGCKLQHLPPCLQTGTPGTGGVLRGRAAAARCRCRGCCPGQCACPHTRLSSPRPKGQGCVLVSLALNLGPLSLGGQLWLPLTDAVCFTKTVGWLAAERRSALMR